MYRLHLKSEPPESGAQFATREDAFVMQKANGWQASHKITFHPSADDLEDWQYREREKFRTGEYVRTPWHFEEPEYAQTEWASTGEALKITYPRFCHLSLDQKGMVAYTPSPEHGMQNRQVRIRPGKYLEQFLTSHRSYWPAWVAKVGAFNGSLQIARTADEIEAVYVHSGSSSCMSGTRQDRRGDYNWARCSQHPVRAYGDSDLAVAYLGDPETRITARCVIWPDRKIHSRLYGDETLRELLRAHGYSAGAVDGARIKAIREQDGWLVPYIDGPGNCRVTRDKDSRVWLLLGEGDLDCQTTNGCTESPEDAEEIYTCTDCGNDVNGDDWVADYNLCSPCYAAAYADCHACCGTHAQEEMTSLNVHGRYGIRARWFCENCTFNCVVCDNAFAARHTLHRDLNRDTINSRISRNIHDHVCPGCDDGSIRYCDTCERTYQPGADTGCSVCDAPVNQQEANDDTDTTAVGEFLAGDTLPADSPF